MAHAISSTKPRASRHRRSQPTNNQKPAPNKAEPPKPAKTRDAEDIERADSEGMAQPQGTKPKKRPLKKPKAKRNPAAVALGRLGGLKGGPARKAKLTPEQLSE